VALAMNPPMQVSSSSSLMSLATTSSQERAPGGYDWERKLWFLGFSALLLGNCRPHRQVKVITRTDASCTPRKTERAWWSGGIPREGMLSRAAPTS
jgi:hypothetical protein